jgi:hypothetical protein
MELLETPRIWRTTNKYDGGLLECGELGNEYPPESSISRQISAPVLADEECLVILLDLGMPVKLN